jgi:hypothetical protein
MPLPLNAPLFHETCEQFADHKFAAGPSPVSVPPKTNKSFGHLVKMSRIIQLIEEYMPSNVMRVSYFMLFLWSYSTPNKPNYASHYLDMYCITGFLEVSEVALPSSLTLRPARPQYAGQPDLCLAGPPPHKPVRSPF